MVTWSLNIPATCPGFQPAPRASWRRTWLTKKILMKSDCSSFTDTCVHPLFSSTYFIDRVTLPVLSAGGAYNNNSADQLIWESRLWHDFGSDELARPERWLFLRTACRLRFCGWVFGKGISWPKIRAQRVIWRVPRGAHVYVGPCIGVWR